MAKEYFNDVLSELAERDLIEAIRQKYPKLVALMLDHVNYTKTGRLNRSRVGRALGKSPEQVGAILALIREEFSE